MRVGVVTMAAICAMALCANEAQAAKRAHHRRPPAKAQVRHGPAHHMSALAAQAARQRQGRPVGGAQFAANDVGTETRVGAFSRSYKLNDVYRPTIRPDQDGAVGVTFKMKTH